MTAGLEDFTVVDETYTLGEPGNHVLITTESRPGVKHLAWTRQYKNSRVFCYASGHDNCVYSNESFRQILGRALTWAASGEGSPS